MMRAFVLRGAGIAVLVLLHVVLAAGGYAEDTVPVWLDHDKGLPVYAQRGVSRWLRTVPKDVKTLNRMEARRPKSPIPQIYESLGPGQWNEAVVKEMVRRKIPIGTRIEGHFFFGYDYQNEATSYRLPAHGWVANHMWRINVAWYHRMPDLLAGTCVRRDGTFFQEYTWGYSHRNVGDPNHPLFRAMREKYLAEIITGKKSYPDEKYAPWEYRWTKVRPDKDFSNSPYALFGNLNELWYDNPMCWASYTPYSMLLWRKHFESRFGRKIVDPASSANTWVRREWIRWWNEKYAEYYKWNYDLIQKLARQAGKDRILVGANVSVPDYVYGPTHLNLLRVGALDQAGPAETSGVFSHGHYAPIFKTALAVSKGKSASIYRPVPFSIGEALACQGQVIGGINFANVFQGLFHNCQPGAKVALLYNLRHSLEEPENVYMQDVCFQLMKLGIPYEIISEEHLSVPYLRNFVTVILQNTELNAGERNALKAYVEGGGNVLAIGSVIEEVPVEARKCNPARPYKTSSDVCITGLFGRRDWRSCIAKAGKGEFRYIAEPIPADRAIDKAVTALGTGDYRLVGPRGNILMNVLRQPKTGETLVGLVNYGRSVVAGVKVKVPASLGAKAAWISGDLDAGGVLTVENGVATVPQLGSYALVLFAPNEGLLQKRLAKLSARGAKVKAPRNKANTRESAALKKHSIRPEDIKANETLYRVRAGNQPDSLMFCCDIVAGLRPSRTGRPWKLRFRFTEGHWGASRYGGTYYENLKLLFVNRDTGYFESVDIPFDKCEYNDFWKNPPKSNERTVQWRPKKRGKYQMFVQYRYVQPWSQGYANIKGVSDYGGTHAVGNRGRKYYWGKDAYDRMRIPIRDKLTVHHKVYSAPVIVR